MKFFHFNKTESFYGYLETKTKFVVNILVFSIFTGNLPASLISESHPYLINYIDNLLEQFVLFPPLPLIFVWRIIVLIEVWWVDLLKEGLNKYWGRKNKKELFVVGLLREYF